MLFSLASCFESRLCTFSVLILGANAHMHTFQVVMDNWFPSLGRVLCVCVHACVEISVIFKTDHPSLTPSWPLGLWEAAVACQGALP